VAESEWGGSRGKRSVARRGWPQRLALRLLCAATLSGFASQSWALPRGASIAAGQAKITRQGGTLTVTSASSRAVLNWDSFSIGPSQTVNFVQPSVSSAVLNRVVGQQPSVIYGHLNANGQVFLVNPQGIVFARGASVNVGGLVASTLVQHPLNNMTFKEL
jgi:filamentous hemagglutinin family protein